VASSRIAFTPLIVFTNGDHAQFLADIDGLTAHSRQPMRK